MNIKNRKEQSDFIFNVYRTTIDYSYWGYVLEKLSSYVNGKASIASIDNHSRHIPIDIFTTTTHGFDFEYIQGIYLLDEWASIEYSHNLGEICIFSEHLEFAELEKTEFYKQWLKPKNIKDGIAIQLFKTENYRIVLNVFFDNTDGLNKLLEDLEVFTPHLSQAVEIWMTSIDAEESSPFQIKEHFLKETCGLTNREIAIAYAHMYVDNSNRIAEEFNISPETVKSSLYNIRQKLGGVSTESMKRILGSFAFVGGY